MASIATDDYAACMEKKKLYIDSESDVLERQRQNEREMELYL